MNMKLHAHTLRNIEDALKVVNDRKVNAPITFLEALEATKPGERENIVILTCETE
jgi:hypothetical protein